ncbi:MAG: NADPH-dependent glutamate synthase [Clostridiales bacterium]|nr:NADPH-dependent glutamate synthase [Clostridiales bacterium]
MANMQKNKTPISEQKPDIRNKNWNEVALGYTEEEAINEALRCLNCKHRPCVKGCPVEVQIPDFIQKIIARDYIGAYETIKETNALPAVCGRVCPQEIQCEAKCVRGIKGESVGIGRLERFCADYAAQKEYQEKKPVSAPTNIKIAVIGSGTAGLSCAGDLAKMGYDVTIFEALHTAGGVLAYGIPEFRLPKRVLEREVDALKQLGVTFKTNTVIGRTKSVDELFEAGFEAIFIGSGAGLPTFIGIPGENSIGVYSANEFLTRINLMKAYCDDYLTPIRTSKRVAVIGGGNVAMDAARCAKRLGAEEVYIVYRRSESEMPARLEEIHHAKEEGIIFKLLSNPIEIKANADGAVEALVCVAMILGEPDASGRYRPLAKPDSKFEIEVDTVIMAIGSSPNPLIHMTTPDLKISRSGCLITADDGVTTSREGVFAGGDAVTGAATVILAMGAGKKAARAIDSYIKNKRPPKNKSQLDNNETD